jgi:hypothetical protein
MQKDPKEEKNLKRKCSHPHMCKHWESATKCDGDRYECARFYRSEKMHNHHEQNHTSRQRYLHFRSWPIYVDINET